MKWKDIPNYKGLYQISDTCIIKRLIGYHCTKERIIKQHKKKCGYMYVSLCKMGKIKTFTVHTLILKSFIGPCPLGMESCHNNGNKENNSINNLRYDTKGNNQRDRKLHGTTSNTSHLDNRGSKSGMAKLNEEQVKIIKYLLKEGKLTLTEIAKIFNVSVSTISDIKRNRIWKYVIIDE